jgi:hypothetical protein
MVAVVVINDDCAGAVKEAQPRIDGRGKVQWARHVAIERDVKKHLLLQSEGVIVIGLVAV